MIRINIRQSILLLTVLQVISCSSDNQEPALPQTIIYQQAAGDFDDLHAIKEDASGNVVLSADPLKADDFEAMLPGDVVVFSRWDTDINRNKTNLDIYAVNLDGSNLTPLADAVENDYFKGVTESGRVVYRSQGKIFSIKADGSDVKELIDSLGAFLQFQTITNDNQVIYTLSGTTYIMPADRSVIPAVTLTDVASHDYVRQAPDGRVIFRSSGILYSVRPDGSDRQNLNPQAGTSVWVAAFSSTGRVIYSDHVNNNDYDQYSVNTDGSDHQPLATTVGVSEQYVGITSNDRVIYKVVNGDMFAVNADGTGSLVNLTNTTDRIQLSSISASNKIIYSRGEFYDLYIVDHDGNNHKPLVVDTGSNNFMAGFTSEGNIIYASASGKGPTQSDLYLINQSGENPVTLAAAPDLGESFWWTTNSDRIIYLANDGVDSEIYSINTDGSDRKVLTSSGGIKRRVYLH